MPRIAYLECSRCNAHLDPATPQTVCTKCAGALYVRYDLTATKGIAHRDAIGTTKEDRSWVSQEGIPMSPEGAASTAAYDHLIGTGFLKSSDRVVLFSTGSGNKYTDVLAHR